MIGAIGFILLLIGASAADGNLLISAVMVFAGLALLWTDNKKSGNTRQSNHRF